MITDKGNTFRMLSAETGFSNQKLAEVFEGLSFLYDVRLQDDIIKVYNGGFDKLLDAQGFFISKVFEKVAEEEVYKRLGGEAYTKYMGL